MAKKQEVNWNKITGVMQVYTNRMEGNKGKAWYKSSVSVGSKDQDNNWFNFYIDLRFVGRKAEAPGNEGKHMIDIVNAFISTEHWYDKKAKEERIKPVIIVTDCEVLE